MHPEARAFAGKIPRYLSARAFIYRSALAPYLEVVKPTVNMTSFQLQPSTLHLHSRHEA